MSVGTEGKAMIYRVLGLGEAIQQIDSDIGDAVIDGLDIPAELVDRAHTFALKNRENVDQLDEFLTICEEQSETLDKRAAAAAITAKNFKDQLARFKHLLAHKLMDGAEGKTPPKLTGTTDTTWIRAQKSGGVESLKYFDAEGNPTESDDHVDNKYRLAQIEIRFPADAVEEIRPLYNAMGLENMVTIAVAVDESIAEDVETMIRDSAAFEGVVIAKIPQECTMHGIDRKTVVNNAQLRDAIEAGEEIPGVKLERGIHLRHSKTVTAVAKS